MDTNNSESNHSTKSNEFTTDQEIKTSDDLILTTLTRPLHSKFFFTLTLTSLSFTLYALFRVFRSTQAAKPLQSVQWQRMRMIGQAGVIGGLTGPLVWEGLGFDTWKLRFQSQSGNENVNSNGLSFDLLNYLLGIFGRTTENY